MTFHIIQLPWSLTLQHSISHNMHYTIWNGDTEGLQTLVGKPLGKCPLGIPMMCEGNIIKMALREIGYECERWTELAQDNSQ